MVKLLKKYSKLLPFLGLFLFLLLLFQIDLNQLIFLTKHIKLTYLLFAFLLLIPFYIIKVLRWHFIMLKQGINLSFLKLLQIYGIGIFLALITPGRIGELFKISYFTKEGISAGKSLVNVIIDRFADIVFLFFFGCFSMLMFLNLFAKTLTLISIIILSIIIVIFIILKTNLHQKIFHVILQKLIPSEQKNAWQINFQTFKKDLIMIIKEHSLSIMAITIISWLLYYEIFYLLGQSLGLNQVPFWFMAITLTISSFVTLIPISISGIGTRDGVFIILLSFYSISLEKAMALSLFVLLIFFVLAIWGLICWFLNPLKS